MKTISTLFILLLHSSSLCNAQTINSTFQGEILNVSPIFLHVEAVSGVVTGFYKYPSDSVVVPLQGTIGSEGDLRLTDTRKPFPVFTGKLLGRLLRGDFRPSVNAAPQAFYAADLRGEYNNDSYQYIGLTLLDKGYMLHDLARGKGGYITTHLQPDGRIYLRCDSLNVKLYIGDNTLEVDTLRGLPSFMSRGGKPVFTLTESFYSGASFEEFPEMDSDYASEGILIKLNDSCSVRVKQIPRSEYVVRKWESEHLRIPPYQVITDYNQARKMLASRVREIAVAEDDYTRYALRITYGDGVKKKLDGYRWEYSFAAYYPQLKVLVLRNEADGDNPIDLNDSTHEQVGDPRYHAVSPDRQWRVTGYYPGGAADCEYYFIERWNKKKKKFELVADDLHADRTFSFSYTGQWFWSNDGKALFVKGWSGMEGSCYEMEIVFGR